MAHDQHHHHMRFGRVLDEGGSEHKVWFFVVPAILAILVLAGVGIYGISQSSSVKTEIAKARAQADELRKTVDARDKLLVAARADEGILKSAGQATALFYGVDRKATESGVVIAVPSEHAAKAILYGLQPPPDGQQYTLAARAPDGSLEALADVPIGADGSAFVVAKNVPEAATAIELVLRDAKQGAIAEAGSGGDAAKADDSDQGGESGKQQPGAPSNGAVASAGNANAGGTGSGSDAGATAKPNGDAGEPGAANVSLDGATTRVAAKFPSAQERGVLTDAPQTQPAKRAAR